MIVVDIGATPAREIAPARGSKKAGRLGAAPLLWIVAALVLVLSTGWGTWSYARSRAYLIEQNGIVAVYQGIPGSFAGVSLNWLVQPTDVPVALLDPQVQARLHEWIPFGKLADALYRVEELRAAAAPPTATPAPSLTTTTPPAP